MAKDDKKQTAPADAPTQATPPTVAEENADLRAENEALRRRIEAMEASSYVGVGAGALVSSKKVDAKGDVPPGFFRAPNGRVVSEEYRGTRKYRTTEKCYLDGRLVQPGVVVTLVDATPSRTFEPLDAVGELPSTPAKAEKRASDREV